MNKTDIPYAKISEKTGVSVTTISRALTQPRLVKHSTLKEIYRAIEELGGILPDNASSISSNIRILAIIPCLDNPFYTSIVQGIQAGANQNNCQLLIMGETITQYNLPQILQFITQSDISGVVIIQKVETQILDLLKMRTQVIQCSEFNESADVSYITIDNIEATKKLMRYILTAGRKQIALVNNDPTHYTYARLRLQAYSEALEQAGIEIDPSYILTIPEGKFSTTVAAVSAMLKRSPIPDAIFCSSDVMATAALRACMLDGYKVPEDIMIAGFDNIDISIMTTPSITTVNQPKHDMGFMACTQLLSMIANPKKETQKLILDTELVLRESTNF